MKYLWYLKISCHILSCFPTFWLFYDIWRSLSIFCVISWHFCQFFRVRAQTSVISDTRNLWNLYDIWRSRSWHFCVCVFREPAQRLSWSRAAWSPCPQTNPTTSAATRTPSTSTTSTSSRSSTSARGSSSTTDSSASSSRRSVGWLVRSLWWRMKNIYQCID